MFLPIALPSGSEEVLWLLSSILSLLVYTPFHFNYMIYFVGWSSASTFLIIGLIIYILLIVFMTTVLVVLEK